MKAKADYGNRNQKRNEPAARRGRANPARQRLEPVAEWEACVNTTSRGPNRPDMRRKVRTYGVKTIDVLDLLEEW